MRLRVIVPVVLAAGLALSACGGGSSTAKPPSGTNPVYKVAGKFPSNSSKMVCAKEAQNDISSNLGVHPTRVTTPVWKDHVYSCTYVYPNGSYALSVKELSDTKSTDDFYNAYKRRLGVAQNLFGLGQGAFIAKNNDVVVRKDYKILFIDVKNVPSNFIPAMTPQIVATNIASVIMGCWADT